MSPLSIAPSNAELFVGRTAAIEDVARTQVASLRRDDSGAANAVYQGGEASSGRLADVRPDVHWLVIPNSSSGLQLLPISAWYEFGIPMHEAEGALQGGQGQTSSRPIDGGEAELRRESGLRKEFAERWESMIEHGLSSNGSLRARGQILRDLRKSWQPSEALERLEILDILERSKAPDLRGTLKVLESLESNPSQVAGSLVADEVPRTTVAYPEELHLNDDTGLDRQRRKKLKALRRKADAVDKAEDEEVPATANALLQLKSERGEGLWDFSDGEEFSDDEQDKWDFDEQLKRPTEEEIGPRLGADDMDAPAAEEGEHGDMLTKHGKLLQDLLRMQEKSSKKRKSGEQKDQQSESSSESELSEGEACFKSQSKQMKLLQAETPVMDSLGQPRKKPKIQACQEVAVGSQKQEHIISSSAKPPNHASAEEAAAAKATSLEQEITDEALRTKAIQCLQERGGMCSLSDAALALGLSDLHSALYKRVVAILRNVADVQRVPGETRPLLALKLMHWGETMGPPLPTGCQWWYVAKDGCRVHQMDSAESLEGAENDVRYRIEVKTPNGGQHTAWLPSAKAPKQCPEPPE